MLKTAMTSAMGRAKVAEEAKKQLQNLHDDGDEDEDDKKSKKDKEKDACSKTSSADFIPTDHILKLAAAADYICKLVKEGENIGPGVGPGALPIGPTTPSGPPHALRPQHGHVEAPPMSIGAQKAMHQEQSATQIPNDYDDAPGSGDAPVNGSTKNAAPIALLRAMAAEETKVSAPIALLRKMAEDAINPSHISAGGADSTKLPVTITGQAGPPAAGKDRVPGTADGVASLTRRAAKSVPKAEMGALLDATMNSAAHDNVLQQTFSHTGESGAKISSAHNVKLAAARALLGRIAEGGQ
jgi:hypothetical protein